jgi:hypothetical protein
VALGLDPSIERAPVRRFSFLYRYALTVPTEFKHMVSPASQAIRLLRIAVRDYQRIAKAHGLVGHQLGDLVFEGVHVDHQARTVTFDVVSYAVLAGRDCVRSQDTATVTSIW